MGRREFVSGAMLATAHLGVPENNAVTLDLGGGTVLRFTTPAPVLWEGLPLPAPVFDKTGNAVVAGLKLKRTLMRVADGYRLRLAVTNQRDTAISLRSLIPLQADGANGLLVADVPVSGWTIFRLARHKNDIPGPYRPTVQNDATRDAATDSAFVTRGDDPGDAGKTPKVFHADPGFVVLADNKPAETHLFVGFDGQTRHLSDLRLNLDAAGSGLERLMALAEFDGVPVAPGETRETHDLYLLTGKPCEGLLADHVERIRKQYGARSAQRRNVFCTWYFYGPEIVADDLRKDLAELKRRPVAFDTFLIDYNWHPGFGDWEANPDRFPQGMQAMADEIRAAGLSPGIWTAPFLLSDNAGVLRRYPDLPLKNRAGKPIEFVPMSGVNRCYVLDPTAPSAEAFLTGLCRKLTGWGYRYLKFDFMRAVLMNEDAVFHERTLNRAQAYRHALQTLRRAAGNDVMIGIWGGLFEANAGIVNINRSGSDVRGHWDPVDGYAYTTRYPVRMRQTFARSFYDEKLWTSDQDALQLRRRTTPWRTTRPHIPMGVFTDEEAFSTVVYRFLGGGVVQVSEKLDELDQDRYDLYKAVIPTYAPVAQRFGAWDDYLPETFVTHFTGHRDLPPWAIVSLCNWNGKEAKRLGFRPADVPDLPPANAYAAFEFRTQKFLGVFRPTESIALDLAPHASRVIRLTPLTREGLYLIGGDLNLSGGAEIERFRDKTITLRKEVRGFPARFTLLDWNAGSAALPSLETIRI